MKKNRKAKVKAKRLNPNSCYLCPTRTCVKVRVIDDGAAEESKLIIIERPHDGDLTLHKQPPDDCLRTELILRWMKKESGSMVLTLKENER